MIRNMKISALLVVLMATVLSSSTYAQYSAKRTRPFHMGFTPFPPDSTEEAYNEMANFLRKNGDIVAQHMESVPWTEALSGAPFRENLTNSWRDRKKLTPPGGKVYVIVNPGRGALADYWGASEHDPLPEEFKGKTFSDPLVKRAYLNYCRRAIEYFKPDVFGIGIEINEVLYNTPDKFPALVELHQYVYKELKKDYPKLPIFASFTLHGLLDSRRSAADREKNLAAVKGLMPYNDLIGISFYPFFGNVSDQVDRSFDWLDSQFKEFHKPYAFAETGEAADKLTVQLDGHPWVIDGSPARQKAYYEKLLAFAGSHDTKFIISFLSKDYDELWKKIAKDTIPVFQAWQDNGMVDEKGIVRPAYGVWKQVFDLPVAP
jgi:hypothetical protein